MPILAVELLHLKQADRWIREGYLRVKSMEANIARAVSLRMDVSQACVFVALTRDNLAICAEYRLHILDAIEHLDGNPFVHSSKQSRKRDETGILTSELLRAFSSSQHES